MLSTTLLPSKDECAHLRTPNYSNFCISLFILLGILISYLPQHHRIIRRRSPEGISPYFVLLGSTAATCALANILLLPRSRTDLGCCRGGDVTGFECFAGMLGIAQVGTQWLCFSFILLLFFIYSPRSTDKHHLTPHHPPPHHTFRTAIVVVSIYVVHALATLIVSIILPKTQPGAILPLATTLGLLAAILTVMQYLPQLYTTFRLKAAGSLSIPMMLIQTPGSFVWAGSLAARMGWSGWSAWGLYVVSGCLQGTLLMMALSYEVAKRRLGTDGDDAPKDDDGDCSDGRRHEENGHGEYDVEAAHRSRRVEEHGERSPLLGSRS